MMNVEAMGIIGNKLPPDVKICQSVSSIETTVAKPGLARACLSLKLVASKSPSTTKLVFGRRNGARPDSNYTLPDSQEVQLVNVLGTCL